jgi:predicted transcriptional regulator
MAETKLPKPTEAELEILKVLWRRGPSTVREVNGELNEARATGYTTTLKFMQIMADKGLLVRDETERAHLYAARLPQAETQQQLVGDLLQRVFEGSARQLVMQALSAQQASAEELAAIKLMLDEIAAEKVNQ